MAAGTAFHDHAPAGPATWMADAGVALLAALVVFAVHLAGGFSTLGNFNGDNDNLLRLVEVRDLLAGQGWFDLHQYRMGPDGGFVMHWSRLVDAPIALLVLAGGETFALIVWPLCLYAAALFLILRSVRAAGGDHAMLPAAIIGGTALHFLGIFAPGALDHHNIQLVLTLAAAAALLAGDEKGRVAAAGGAAAALMLAIGMEAAPYVAVAGLVAAGCFAFGGDADRRRAIGFGIAFAVVSAAAFVVTIPVSAWGSAQCDAYSVAQFALAVAAGTGLAAAAFFAGRSSGRLGRNWPLVAVGIVVAGLAILLFPQCLADPYAGLDPRLKEYWLNSVIEAQTLWSVLDGRPAMAASYYATPLLALAVLAWRMARNGLFREDIIVMAFLLVAFMVSAWQVRGAMFSIPLATIALAAWVGDWRKRASGKASAMTVAAMALAWLVSFNVFWSAAAGALARIPSGEASSSPAKVAGRCHDATDYAGLAEQPPATVLAISNLGAPILRYTGHRVLSGPYHRNVAGNLAALTALMAPLPAAEAEVRRNGVTLVAFCPGNDETGALAEWAPEGLAALLLKGTPPSWLAAAGDQENSPVKLFKVLP